MPDDTTLDPGALGADRARERPLHPAWIIAWSRSEAHRVGEVGPLRGEGLIGRGDARPDDAAPRVSWLRQRPGDNTPTGPLESPAISRAQLVARPGGDAVEVTCVGRRPLWHRGRRVDRATVRFGETVTLEDELVLLLDRRPVALPPSRAWPSAARVPFGEADPFGMVGESPEAWALRDELAFCAARGMHVLLTGPTGSGKELAARAIHGLHDADRALVARNAATLPEGLLDAELFGNVADYPNAGMRAREGLIGAADGSTLFLDEIGELPEALQAHLLRVLDGDGEYHRLGEARARRSRFRLVGATNRPEDALKHDLLARLPLRVSLPPLAERRADVPLLIRHLLRRAAEGDGELRSRFFDDRTPRVAPEVVATLTQAPLEGGVRGLSAALWRCVQKSTGDWIALDPGLERELERRSDPPVAGDALDARRVREALEATDWVVSHAYRELGLKNRHVLIRLMKKLGVEREG
ncbi:MAG: sigma 54-interacting transcriptional regulator [Myxococcota bacterium]|nr:sigma 54-interacting transcriptional regulator [Myxococcota bacterium]